MDKVYAVLRGGRDMPAVPLRPIGVAGFIRQAQKSEMFTFLLSARFVMSSHPFVAAGGPVICLVSQSL